MTMIMKNLDENRRRTKSRQLNQKAVKTIYNDDLHEE